MNQFDTLSHPATGMIPNSDNCKYQLVEHSKKERIERWFYKPLEKLNHGNESILLLHGLFPLIERYLRYKVNMNNSDTFSEGCEALKELGKLLNCPEAVNYKLWQMGRHGLAHRFALKFEDGTTMALYQDTERAITIENSHFKINPYRLRDLMLKIFRNNKKMWENDDFPLMKEFTEDQK